ncbi:MAG: VWA-like domain-containing protein [Candidatus Sumerlaeota bacterium]|nr:VWA-like domain-containing protein [Candidatus Sumerlaeota bacterium]
MSNIAPKRGVRQPPEEPAAPLKTDMREHMETSAADRIMTARCALMFNAPFFGSLIAHLKFRAIWPEDWPTGGIATAGTDGVDLLYNPAFILSLSNGELAGVLVHEVLHAALDHPSRLKDRDWELWNAACDYVVNGMIHACITDSMAKRPGANQAWAPAQWCLPSGALHNSNYRGMSADHVYARLSSTIKNEKGGLSILKLRKGIRNFAERLLEEAMRLRVTWLIPPKPLAAAEDAARQKLWAERLYHSGIVSRFQGSFPAELVRLIKGMKTPVVDWRSVLRTVMLGAGKNDYSWARPNLRLLSQNYYLPGMYSPEIGEIVVVIDTSGSCYNVASRFVSEIGAILEEFHAVEVHVVTCDVEAKHIGDWRSGGECPDLGKGVALSGWGGTSFVMPFELVREKQWRPEAVVYLTDMMGIMPPPGLNPGCPVLWVTPEKYAAITEVPFGMVLPLIKNLKEEM